MVFLSPPGSYCLRIDIWEKGNVGMPELSQKLKTSFQHALCDYMAELYLFPLPVARPLPLALENLRETRAPTVSPYVLIEVPLEESVTSEDTTKNPQHDEDGVSLASSVRPVGEEEPGKPEEEEEQEEEGVVGGKKKLSLEQLPAVPTSVDNRPTSARATPTAHGRGSHSRAGSEGRLIDQQLGDAITIGALQSVKYKEQVIDDIMLLDDVAAAGGGSVVWAEKERLRREQEAKENVHNDAYAGNSGTLEATYHSDIPHHFSQTLSLGSPTVQYSSFPLVGSYSALIVLSQTLAEVKKLCPDLTVTSFKSSPSAEDQFTHFTPERDWSKVERTEQRVYNASYVALARSPSQWRECRNPNDPALRVSQPWVDPQSKQSLQFFHPLDCRKISRSSSIEVPFQHAAKARNSFVPRQRLVLLLLLDNNKVFGCC